jgi:hypothetical protein
MVVGFIKGPVQPDSYRASTGFAGFLPDRVRMVFPGVKLLLKPSGFVFLNGPKAPAR